MKNISLNFKVWNYYLSQLDFWILDNIFQKFSELSYKYLRLTNFFWAAVSMFVSLVLMLYRIFYVGLYLNMDPLILLPAIIMAVITIPALRYTYTKSHMESYDNAVYGLENEFRQRHAETRRGSLFVILTTVLVFIPCWIRNGATQSFGIIIDWFCLSQYPTFAFCSCSPPMRNRI